MIIINRLFNELTFFLFVFVKNKRHKAAEVIVILMKTKSLIRALDLNNQKELTIESIYIYFRSIKVLQMNLKWSTKIDRD